jgi:hypothetical protein
MAGAPGAPAPVASSAGEADDEGDAGAPSDEALCAMPPAQTAELATARSFVPSAVADCATDPFCDTVERPANSADTCVVAATNLARAQRESRVFLASTTAPPPAPSSPRTPPKYLDRLDAHLHLTTEEKATLQTNGFVVLDRFAYASYANAFHDVFQEQLPLFVSADAAMHAVFRGDELVLERIERKQLHPALHTLLARMRSGLAAARPHLAADTVHDLDVYLGVANALADDTRGRQDLDKPARRRTLFGHDDEVAALVEQVDGHKMTDPDTGLELFGRARVIDFSQFEPRGHYVDSYSMEPGPGLSAYFEAVTWLSRVELNLVSRSCRSSQPGAVPDPAETPREAVDALALAEIACDSGAVAQLQQFEDVYRTFAGKREDVSVPDLLAIEKRGHLRASDPAAATDLKLAIGEDFQRTARTHFMPAGADRLPAIATLIGVRVVPDVAPLTTLVEDSVAGRTELGAADVGYLLGHDRARAYLKDDLARYPALAGKLDAARAQLRAGADGRDVYAGWLRTVLAVAAPVPAESVVPSFVRTDAYRDRRLDSALVGFGQIRHAFTLLAAQGYDSYGCEIPDGYVEPALAQWDALVDHVHQVHEVSGGFVGLERTLRMLRDIARTESTGAPLSEPQRRWLGMVSEYRPKDYGGDSGEPPKWSGWYFDMFEDREQGASKNASFVADYFTLTNAGEVRYLGADTPRLGIFVVDVGGEPRAMVGPVAKGYETTSGLDERLDDEKAVEHGPKLSPWRASFAPPVAPTPRLGLRGHILSCGADKEHPAREVRIALRARVPLGKVTLTALDHHGDPLGPAITTEVGATWQTVVLALPGWAEDAPSPAEAIAIHVQHLAVSGLGTGAYDASSRPSNFGSGYPMEQIPAPVVWAGVSDFVLGGAKAK